MSFIYKKLEPNAISITPFPVYKTLTAISGSNTNDIELFRGYYYGGQKQINSDSWPITENNEYQYLVFDSIKHLYYNLYDKNQPDLTINRDKKEIFNECFLFSIPRNSFGEGIRKGMVSIAIQVSESIHNIIDDSYGNLIDATVSSSLSYKIETYQTASVGRWNFSDGYEFKKGTGLNQISNKYIYDRSLNGNHAKLTNIQILSESYSQTAYFYNSGSNITIDHNDIFNFKRNEDFYISCLLKIPTTSSFTGSIDFETIISKNDGSFKFQYNIQMLKSGGDNGKIQFDRNDGNDHSIVTSSVSLNDGNYHHIICQKTGSLLELYIDGTLNNSGSDFSSRDTHNSRSLYIGMLGNHTHHLHANIKEVEIKETALSSTMINEISQNILSQSFNYYVGNIFYPEGIAVITSDNQFYRDFFSYIDLDSAIYPVSWSFNGYGTNKIYEYEFLCTTEPGDYNYSWNDSLFKESRRNIKTYKDFATSSLFTPYVTKVGLYNDKYELLAIGKISKPIPRLKNMEMTYIVRFDV